jgi:hypothetical protein
MRAQLTNEVVCVVCSQAFYLGANQQAIIPRHRRSDDLAQMCTGIIVAPSGHLRARSARQLTMTRQ